MAIRVGSGELKYPLPSQAQLGAQRSAAAASAGGSASASAYGANRAYAGLKKRLAQDSEQADLTREFQAEQNFYDREQRAGEIRYLSGARIAESLAVGQQRGQQDMEMQILEGIRRGELELPEASQRQLRQLDAAEVDAMKLEPGQIEEFRGRKRGIRSRLLGTVQPVTRSAGADLNRQLAYYDQQDGKAYDEMKPGRVPMLNGRPLLDQQDPMQGFNDAVMKKYEKNLGETDELGEPLYGNEDEALKAAVDIQGKIERGRQKLRGQTAQPAAQQTVQPSVGPAAAPSVADSATGRYWPDSWPDQQQGGGAKPQAQQQARITPEAFATQWAAMEPGERLQGPDGRVYIKKPK